MNPFVSRTSDHLLQLLAGTDITVPPRALGRTKEHTQRWAISRLLATLADTASLRFPLELTTGERPDFVLVRAGDQAGIEATEAIHMDHARIDALRNMKGDTEPRLYQRIRAGEPPKSLAEVQAIARGEVDSPGWDGDSVEQDWAEAMRLVIRRKVERFEQAGFRKFPENWLLIYDNWELPFLDRDEAAQKLSTHLSVNSEATPFNRVFIETGNLIFEFQTASCMRLPLKDLWNITTLDD